MLADHTIKQYVQNDPIVFFNNKHTKCLCIQRKHLGRKYPKILIVFYPR